MKIPTNITEEKAVGNEQLKREFFLAVINGDTPRVRKLLKSGIDPNISTDDLQGVLAPKDIPAVLYAADNADIETMNEFLRSGINLRKENSNIRNILAFYVGSTGSKNASTGEDSSVRNTHVGTLFQAGASLDAANTSGQTLLMIVAEKGDIVLLRKLINLGAPLNARNKYGSTVLTEISVDAKIDIMEVLLRAGADPNIVSDWEGIYGSALMHAVGYRQIKAAKLLLSFKANANLKRKDGMNALGVLFSREGEREHHLELLQLLIGAGADVNTFFLMA